MKDKAVIVVYGVLFVVLLDCVITKAPFLLPTFSALFCIGYCIYRLADTHMWKKHGYPAATISNRLPIPLDLLYFGANLLRVWRLHRTVLELILPPHLICPPELDHLSLDQWRRSAPDYWPALHDAEQNARSYKFFDEWLRAQGLPPLPGKERTKRAPN